jgi:hypothetical protein
MQLPGTRPGPHGLTLISTGHSELDKILGGGLPLGFLLLVLEDGTSGHHITLLKYFLAEGAACGQVGMCCCDEENVHVVTLSEVGYKPRALDPSPPEAAGLALTPGRRRVCCQPVTVG